MRTTRLMIGVLAVAVACRPAAETEEQRAARMRADADSARSAIDALHASFVTHFNAGHADSVGMIFAEDAIFMQPNMPAANGRAAIIEAIRRDQSMIQNMRLQLTTENFVASGDLAVERGRYRVTGNVGGQAIADSGKYLTHWHRTAGGWKMAEDIYNSDMPAAPAPPARRRA